MPETEVVVGESDAGDRRLGDMEVVAAPLMSGFGTRRSKILEVTSFIGELLEHRIRPTEFGDEAEEAEVARIR